MIKLSIVIGNYKTYSLTKACIESIYKHKPKFPFEVIVVDDASPDKSGQKLKVLEKSLNNLKIILVDKNQGYVKTNNLGLKRSVGEYKLLLNSDTLVHREALDNLVEFAEKTKEVGIVGSKLINSDSTLQASCYNFPSIWNVINYKKFAPKSKEPIVVDAVVGASFLITPKAYKLIGNLSEKYVSYFEDLDYCREVKKKGLKVYYLPTSVVTHYHGESFKQLADEKNQWKKLIPSSIAYHGLFKHYILYIISWIYQKLHIFLWLLLVTIFTIPAFWNLLRPGFFPMQDDLQAFRVQQLDKCLDDGQIPCRWVPDAGYGYGYPQFNYYPPLPYYVGAILHRIGVQYIDSVKILFIAGYILSALTMFLLVSSLFKSKWAGFVSAILYTYIPYKAVEVYVRGALSEFWAQIFFPLIFFLIYKLIKTGKQKFLIWLAVSIALLALTHTLMTMIFAPVAILWAAYWLWSEKWNNIAKIVWSGLIGFSLSAFYLLPVVFEKKFVHIESMLSGYFDYRAHFVSLHKLFVSTEWGYGSSGFPDELLNLSLGLVQWVVGIGAIVLALLLLKKNKEKSQLTLGLGFMTLASIFMIHMKSSFIWAKLSFLWYMQFPWRFLALSIFLLCLLSGFFVFFSKKFKYVLGVILIVISIVLNIGFFVPKDWLNITDADKFSGVSWQKQMTISIFDYLPIYATLPPINEAPAVPEIMDGTAEIIEYKKGSDFQTGKLNVLEDATIRLPLFDFPGMVVKVNGEKISHYNNDCRGHDFCYGLITFKLSKGEYQIEVKLTDTPARQIGNIITLVSGIILLWLISKKAGR